MTKNLDMLTDEPLELAVALRKLAETKAGEGEGDGQGVAEVFADDERACWRIAGAQ